jgi:hypothetical protein
MLLSKEEFMKIKKELVEGNERTPVISLILPLVAMLSWVECVRYVWWPSDSPLLFHLLSFLISSYLT